MAGWNCPDREIIEWDGTLKAKKLNGNVNLFDGQKIDIVSDEGTGTTEYSIKLKWLTNDAKPKIAWWDESDNPKVWLVAHDYLSFPGTQHKHFSVETTNASGTLTTRMEFPFDADVTDIETHDSNFVVGGTGNLEIAGGDFILSTATSIQGAGNVNIYPTNQTTIGLQLASDGTNLEITGLGTSTIEWFDAFLIGTTNKIQFRDTGLFINSSVDGQLDIDADAEIEITSPIVDINASTGLALDGANLNSTWTVNTTNKIQWRDTGLYVYSSVDGQLDVVADTLLQLGATGNLELNDGVNIIIGTTTGTKIGTATTQKIGFYNVTPIVQPSAYTQTYSTADKTHAASTFAAVSETAATTTLPFGYTTAAQADAIPRELNDLADDVTDLKNLVNSLIDDLQALGLVA